MEYLKNAPDDIRRELALEIIDFIKEYTDFEKDVVLSDSDEFQC